MATLTSACFGTGGWSGRNEAAGSTNRAMILRSPVAIAILKERRRGSGTIISRLIDRVRRTMKGPSNVDRVKSNKRSETRHNATGTGTAISTDRGASTVSSVASDNHAVLLIRVARSTVRASGKVGPSNEGSHPL